MKGMSNRVTHFYKSENFEKETIFIPQNGTRFERSKIIRPTEERLQYKVTGWDMQMNTVKTVVDDMEQAIDLSLSLLGGSARIRPVRLK